MVNTRMLQESMKSRGVTLEKASDALRMSRTGLFNKIHNKTEFKTSEIDQISKLLKLSKADMNRIFFANRVE